MSGEPSDVTLPEVAQSMADTGEIETVETETGKSFSLTEDEIAAQLEGTDAEDANCEWYVSINNSDPIPISSVTVQSAEGSSDPIVILNLEV